MLLMGESVTDHPLRETPACTISTWSGSAREQAVQRMFTAIAGVYDLNNTLLSFGLHYRWKKITASYVPCVALKDRALDVGCRHSRSGAVWWSRAWVPMDASLLPI